MGNLFVFPRWGTSLYGLLTDGAWDYRAFARILGDAGCTLTDVWGLTANWVEQARDIVWPFAQRPDGRWDLFAWNPAYFERLEAIVAEMNARGVLVQLTLTELYGWSGRKQGLPGVPDANAGPWRHNVNGIRWGGSGEEDDHWFTTEPQQWLREYINRVIRTVNGAGVIVRLGNEMPEKDLHYRLRDVVRQAWPGVRVVVNRNEDVPGQYANMRIGTDFDLIEFHGRRDLGTLDEVHDNGSATDRPATFRELLNRPDVDCRRIVLSSDGCRASTDPVHTYDWDRLFEVVQYGAARGASCSHQSRAKMTRIQTGRADLGMIETDFLQRLRTLYA